MGVDQKLTARIHSHSPVLESFSPFYPNFEVSRRVVIIGGDDRKNDRREEEQRNESWEGVGGHQEDEKAIREERALEGTGGVHGLISALGPALGSSALAEFWRRNSDRLVVNLYSP